MSRTLWLRDLMQMLEDALCTDCMCITRFTRRTSETITWEYFLLKTLVTVRDYSRSTVKLKPFYFLANAVVALLKSHKEKPPSHFLQLEDSNFEIAISCSMDCYIPS